MPNSPPVGADSPFAEPPPEAQFGSQSPESAHISSSRMVSQDEAKHALPPSRAPWDTHFPANSFAAVSSACIFRSPRRKRFPVRFKRSTPRLRRACAIFTFAVLLFVGCVSTLRAWGAFRFLELWGYRFASRGAICCPGESDIGYFFSTSDFLE